MAMSIIAIAEACHEMNRLWCEALGDFSQPRWIDAPDWQKESAINGVAFHARSPDSTPKDSHESWMKQKAKDGWIYGPIKDPEYKTHPCMVPYEELPADQRAKDEIFIGTIRIRFKANTYTGQTLTQRILEEEAEKHGDALDRLAKR